MRIFATLALILSLTSLATAAERQYLIKLKICKGNADAKAGDPGIKVEAAPQMLMPEGKTCIVKTGEEILLPDFGTKTVDHAETGITAVVNCRRVDDESVRLDMKLNYMDVTVNQPETFVLSDIGARVLLKAKLNTPIKTMLNEKEKLATWVEVEVEEVIEGE